MRIGRGFKVRIVSVAMIVIMMVSLMLDRTDVVNAAGSRSMVPKENVQASPITTEGIRLALDTEGAMGYEIEEAVGSWGGVLLGIKGTTPSVTFSSDGGSNKVMLSQQSEPDAPVKATADKSWITVTVNNTNESVTIKAPKNTGSKRTGTVTVTDKGNGSTFKISVTQNAAPTPTPTKKVSKPTATNTPIPKLQISQTTLPFSNSKGSKTVTLSNRMGDVTIEYDKNTSSWVTAAGGGDSYTITVKENPNASPRSGEVVFIDTKTGNSVSVTITQDAAPTPTPKPTATSSPTPSPKPTATSSPTPSPKPTNTPTPRAKLAIEAPPKTFPHEGSSQTIKLTNRVGDITVEYTGSTNSWATVSGGGDSYTVSVAENSSYDVRNGQIVFLDTKTGDSVVVAISQKGSPRPTATPSPTPTPKFAVAPRDFDVDNKGGSKTFTLSNQKGDITVDYDQNTSSWVTVSGGGNSYVINVKENKKYEIRTGKVVFIDSATGESVRVYINQGAAPTPTPTPELKLKNRLKSFGYEGSEQKVELLNVKGEITIEYAEGTESWVSVSGRGNIYTISVDRYLEIGDRAGMFAFIDKSTGQVEKVYIRQTGVEKLSTSDRELEFPYEGEKKNIKIYHAIGDVSIGYGEENQKKWITVSGEGGLYTIVVSENIKNYDRTAEITFVDQLTGQKVTVNVHQKEAPTRKLTASKYDLVFPAGGLTETISFTNVVGELSYEFDKVDLPWVHVAGTGDMRLVTVDRNDQYEIRSGKIIFIDPQSGQYVILNITQECNPKPEVMPVKFVHYGSVFEVINQIPSKTIQLPMEPERHGYTFLGWFTTEKGGLVVKATDKVDHFIDTIYAHWRSDKARLIRCYLNYPGAEEVYLDGYAEVGENYDLPLNVRREGYMFLGWYTEESGGERVYPSQIVREGDSIRSLYAHYKPVRVRLRFFLEDTHGERVDQYYERVADFGDLIWNYFPKVANPKKYQIGAWTNSNGDYVPSDALITSTSTQCFYAEWEETGYYTVIFDGNGSLEGGQIKKRYQRGVAEDWPEELFDHDIGFDAWGTTRDGLTGKVYFTKNQAPIYDIAGSDASITLYALWKKGTVEYYDPFRGTMALREKVSHAFYPRRIEDFSQLNVTGLRFMGWTTKPKDMIGGPVEYSSSDPLIDSGDVLTLYPVYEIKDKNKILLMMYDPANKTKDLTVRYVPVNTESFSMTSLLPYDQLHELDYWMQRDPLTLQDRVHAFAPKEDVILYNDVLLHPNILFFTAVWKYIKQELVLRYNGGFPPEHIIVDTDNYILPSPHRDGYVFLGWSTDGKTPEYPGGTGYTVPLYGQTLYGVWDTIKFTVEYYDGITGNLLGVQEKATVVTSIEQEPVEVQGMTFYGWTDKKPETKSEWDLDWTKKKLKRDRFYQTGDIMFRLPYEDGIVRLYSCYVQDSKKKNGRTVIYVPNAEIAAPTPGFFKKSEDIVVAKDPMNMEDRLFVGWRIAGYYVAGSYKGGETISKAFVTDQDVVFLIAHWVSKYKLELDPDISGQPIQKLSDVYFTGDKISTDELIKRIPSKSGCCLIGLKTSLSNQVYSPGQYIEVPKRDMRITAVWKSEKREITYVSGFDERVLGHYSFEGEVNIIFDKNKFLNLTPKGYTFVGWTTKYPAGRPWEVKKEDIITEKNNTLKVLEKNIVLYSCYEERQNVYPGTIMVIYNPSGGKGGPGVEYYSEIKEADYRLSNNCPERDGYRFAGWGDSWGVGVDDKTFPSYVERDSKVLRLYAIWVPVRSNEIIKTELQALYGKGIMKDYMFVNEYESGEWEIINDHAYFILKTRRIGSSIYSRDYETKVMVVDYNGKEWTFYGGGPTSSSLEKKIEYFIVDSSEDDESAEFGKLACKGAFLVLKNVPYVKWILMADEIYAAVNDFLVEWDNKGDAYRKIKRVLTSTVLNKIFNAAVSGTDDLVDAELLEMISSMIEEIAPRIDQYIDDILSQNDGSIRGVINVISKLSLAGSEEEYKRMLQDAFLSFAEFDSKINMSIGKYLANKYSKRYELMCIENRPDLDSFFTGVALDVPEFIVESIIDMAKHINRDTKLDPMGKNNKRIKQYQESIVHNGFIQSLADTLPDYLYKMYKEYYTP